MEFGSKYVYYYGSSDEESVSDEEFSAGITDDSNPVDQPDVGGAAAAQGSSSKKTTKPHKWTDSSESSEGAAKSDGKKWRQADTNVVAIRFDQLTKPSNMHTGDAISCKRCHAVMSHLSTIKDPEADEKIWQCEFCEEQNVVDILAEEIPTEADVTYMISPAPATTATSCLGDENSMVVFCIDVSGSMGGHVGNMSRLQCVKAAVMNQLKQLRDEHSTRKVALVTFDTHVSIFGDGTSAADIVRDINNYEKLVKIGTEAAVPTDIKSSFNSLRSEIAGLHPGSETALGPALVISIFMASKMPGSKVVLCTDGFANCGVGSLSSGSSEQCEFYERLGETASSLGVVVSVLTVADTDCRLIEIGSTASATGGHVNVVDPRKLTDELGEIFVSNLIAVAVSATFVVHSGLYIRSETEMTSSLTRNVGNVTKDTDITFEYGVRSQTNSRSKDSGEAGASSSCTKTPTELPFQLQVKYTDLDGGKAMRVLTQVQQVTSDRAEAEAHINVPVVTCHASKRSSKMAMDGDYTPSRLNALMCQRLVARNTRGDPDTYRMYSEKMRPVEQQVLRKQMVEARSAGSEIPRYENLLPDEDVSASGLGSKLMHMYKRKSGPLSKPMRRMHYTDSEAKDLYSRASTTVTEIRKK